MVLKFFDNFINKQYDEGRIDSKYPNEKGNVMVCCPFPHKRKTLNQYTWKEEEEQFYEKVPSASINKDMGAFNCFVCGEHYNEMGFAQALTGKSSDEIIKDYLVKEELEDVYKDWQDNQHKNLLANTEIMENLRKLNISYEIINELNLGCMTNCLATPVFKNNELINIVRYNINKLDNVPKVRYNENSKSGDIVPFDIWKNDKRNTILCEGEKDMLVARSFGFNAITITGGSQASLQKEYLEYFRGRNVNIVYDNDNAGLTGSKRMYKDLENYCNVYVTDIAQVCKEEKEDVSDFFNKYNKSANDFIALLRDYSRKLTKQELNGVNSKNTINKTKLVDNIKSSKFKSRVRSSFQIIATCTDTYAIPEYAIFRLKDGMEITEEQKKVKTWFLKDSNGDFLELMEGKVKTKDIPDLLASMCYLPPKWYKMYDIEMGKLKTVYKCVVTDEMSDTDEKANEETVDLYTFRPLEIGSIYDVEYKLYPHPKEGQKTIAVAQEIKETEYTFDKNDKSLLESLNVFKVKTNVNAKLEALYQSAKHHISPYLNKSYWFLMELVFNSPLDITYNKPIRGALDVFALGDTRTGKSEAVERMIKLYDFGEKITLKTATVASLIGGTDERLKRTKLGVLPRHHKELVVLEEFSGAPMDFIKTLTEIRSSSLVKIYRVAGDIQAPCKLRMLTISNPMSFGGNMMQISSYPNGVEPFRELIKSPEDIARYDACIILPFVKDLTDESSVVLDNSTKIDKICYENKAKWIKSLGCENVIIQKELGSYIFNKALELNNMFSCSFPLFSSETNKKIARMSAALACMLCSTNDYEHVIVTKEHVDTIVSFMLSLYDNEVFRLKEFANEEKSYKIVKEEDTKTLNEIYPKNVTLIDFLANNSRVGRNELITISGIDKDAFNKIFNLLAARKFIKLERDQVVPTIKFRETYRLLDRSFNLYDINS